jgi:hypothetical protein
MGVARDRHGELRRAVDGVPLTMYKIIRNLHLLLASFSLPFLIMYGISAVQMSHSTWFQMKPAVHVRELSITAGLTDARAIAREVMDRDRAIAGEVSNIQPNDAGMVLRIVVPGTVHEVRYDRASGLARVKTSVAGVMGMLNRLHHWAGFWHEPASMKVWGFFVAIASAALLLLGASGIYMWFTRRPERRIGIALLAINLAFAVTVLTLLRISGP